MKKRVEVRGFGDLRILFEQRGWPFPYLVEITEPCTVLDLARQLDIPLDKVEVAFVNGLAEGLEHPVKPGDRVSFVPPGTPGPYRVFLGFIQKKAK